MIGSYLDTNTQEKLEETSRRLNSFLLAVASFKHLHIIIRKWSDTVSLSLTQTQHFWFCEDIFLSLYNMVFQNTSADRPVYVR